MALATNLFEDTHWLLEQWALWVKTNNLGTYPSVTPFRRMLGGGIREPKLGDDYAGMVDRAIAELKKRNSRTGRAVCTYYLSGCNLAAVTRKLEDCDRRDANDLVNTGVAWIDAHLDIVTVDQKGLQCVHIGATFSM